MNEQAILNGGGSPQARWERQARAFAAIFEPKPVKGRLVFGNEDWSKTVDGNYDDLISLERTLLKSGYDTDLTVVR